MTPRVCLDACVLYPTVLREILMGCAGQGLFAPVWSDRVLEEWARATVKLGPGAEEIARADIALLRDRWPGASVPARAGDMARLHLPDANDVHVLATAIASSSDTICTFNARDFPRATLAHEGVERVDPDQLLRRLHGSDAGAVEGVVAEVHAVACRMSGEDLPLRPLMKRARLPRLGRLIGA